VQLNGPALLFCPQEPRTPIRRVGPSDIVVWVLDVRDDEGEITSRATWLWRITTGDRKAKRERRNDVSESTGAR